MIFYQSRQPLFKNLALLFVGGGCLALLTISSFYLYLSPKLPSVQALKETRLQVPLRVYSRNLKLIGEFGEKRRIPVTINQAPPLFLKAILAAEDDRFYEHGGVDLKSLMRATSQLVSSGEIQSGGSTITMQVARNFFLSSNQTFLRKFSEILLALEIERELSKDEILELYINKIFLGNRAYGIGAAAQVYYGVDVNKLTLAQMATLAGLPKAPSTNNPVANPDRAKIRRDWILGRMLKLGYIYQKQYDSEILEPLNASYHDTQLDVDAPYVAEMARQAAFEKFGEATYTDGYQVITTVDEKLQQVAQQAVRDGILDYEIRHGYRGAEGHLNDTALADNNALLLQLKQIPVIGGEYPAVILAMTDGSITTLLPNGTKAVLNWAKIRSQLAPYIDEDHTGSEPDKPANVFKPGDLVRLLRVSESEWMVVQLPKVQGALVSLNPDSGAIISLVGGFDYQQSKYNRIIQANRQPGSNFKPFFYTTALEHGFNAASIINDAPLVFNDANLENTWRPENSTGEFLGPTRLRKALYLSRNLVSVRLLKTMGIQTAIEGAQRFGFNPDQLPNNLSLALGSLSVPPLTIATGYATFANGGYKIDAYLVDRILDSQKHEIYKASPLTVCHGCDDTSDTALQTGSDASINPPPQHAPRIIDKRTHYIMDSILKDVVKKGTATKALALKRSDIAGKTGTTNGPTDLWFSGYNPTLITTTWIGFDNNKNLGRREFGGSAALPIWMDFMRAALAGTPEVIFPQPEGLVMVRIDEKTGQRAKPGQPDSLFEIFKTEDAPVEGTEKNATNPASKSEDTAPEDLF